jgi:hypothetical protein
MDGCSEACVSGESDPSRGKGHPIGRDRTVSISTRCVVCGVMRFVLFCCFVGFSFTALHICCLHHFTWYHFTAHNIRDHYITSYCIISSYLIPSHLISSHLLSSYPILSHPIFSHPILSYLSLSRHTPSYFASHHIASHYITHPSPLLPSSLLTTNRVWDRSSWSRLHHSCVACSARILVREPVPQPAIHGTTASPSFSLSFNLSLSLSFNTINVLTFAYVVFICNWVIDPFSWYDTLTLTLIPYHSTSFMFWFMFMLSVVESHIYRHGMIHAHPIQFMFWSMFKLMCMLFIVDLFIYMYCSTISLYRIDVLIQALGCVSNWYHIKSRYHYWESREYMIIC